MRDEKVIGKSKNIKIEFEEKKMEKSRELQINKKTSRFFSRLATEIGLTVLISLFLLVSVCGQQNGFEHTKGKTDQILRSNARVNPSTLAVELSVPIEGLPGRAGATMPLVFNYSSKVWRFDAIASGVGINGDKTQVRPDYAFDTSAGWTSTYGIPKLETAVEPYNCSGVGMAEADPLPANCGSYQYVKRIRVKLPDGSSHELRKDDQVYSTSNLLMDRTGIYYAVDGSKMRLEWGAQGESVLLLPDGGRYFFNSSEICDKYLDRNGNRLDYNSTTGSWTDTMGRTVTSPLPVNQMQQQNQVEGTQTFNVAGLNNTTRQMQLVWKKLSTGSLISGETLAYDSTTCNSNISPINRNPTLFQSTFYTKLCSTRGGYFDPVVLKEIILPNGSKFTFQYNKFGEIARIDYPSGGYEKFAYGQIPALSWDAQENNATSFAYQQTNRGVTERRVGYPGIAQEMITQYAVGYEGTSYETSTYYVQTIAPNGIKNKRYLYRNQRPIGNGWGNYGFDTPLAGMERESQTFDSLGNLRSRKLFEWETIDGPLATPAGSPQRDARMRREISIVIEPGNSNALATMTEINYDSNADVAYFAQLNPKQTKSYNFISISSTTAQTGTLATIGAMFGSGQLANTSETDFLYDGNYKARNISGLAYAARVKDPAGNIVSQSQIYYDEGSYPILSSGGTTGWEDPATNYRGNATTARSWLNTNNSWIETHSQYDNFGNMRKIWDAKSNMSEVEYASSYYFAYPTKTISTIPDPSGNSGSSTAFETTATYDTLTGLPLTTTDANGQVTQIQYNDPLLRPTRVIPPNGGAVSEMIYNDVPNQMWVKTRTQIDGTNWKEAIAFADGLGRTIKTQSIDNQGDVFSEMVYDVMGRAYLSSNPYRVGETQYWTQTNFDVVGRVKEIVTPDGAKVQTNYDVSTSNLLGSVVTVTDQANKQRRSITNALGQLMRVDEPDDSGNLGSVASPTQATNYSYDTLSNLVQVNQGVQQRNFSYNSLSRLLTATNPESGTINYSYDNNGNLTQKTDARGVVTNYVYDNLNRAISRIYNDGTPNVTYKYDNLTFAKGKLVQVASSISTTNYTNFDNLGRILNSQQITDGQTYNFGYSYNLSGALVNETYPSGRIVTNNFESDGDLAQVNGSFQGQNKTYVGNLSYTSAGAVSSLQLGNGRWENTTFNARLQPVQIGLGSSANAQDLWKVNYDYGTTDNNGNVKSQTITVPSQFTAVQNYSYDSLNRLKSANETISGSQTWKQTFTFDRYGNRKFDASQTTTLGNCPVAVCNPDISTTNNRVVGHSFDNSGNTTIDGEGRTFFYDAENKQKEVRNAQNQIIGQYLYDGNGARVKKISNAETTIFVYDAGGKLASEYLITASQSQAPTTSYLTNDTLGSPRVTTDSSGNIVSRRDFRPYGEEIYRAGQGTDKVRQKFTSYERDNETELDYAKARMYASKLGRFMSVDPISVTSQRLADPQQLNIYSYCRNNPLLFVDSDGERLRVRGEEAQRYLADLESILGISLALDKEGNVYLADPEELPQNLPSDAQQILDAILDPSVIVGIVAINGSNPLSVPVGVGSFNDPDAGGDQVIDYSDIDKLTKPNQGQAVSSATAKVVHETIEAIEGSKAKPGSARDQLYDSAHKKAIDAENVRRKEEMLPLRESTSPRPSGNFNRITRSLESVTFYNDYGTYREEVTFRAVNGRPTGEIVEVKVVKKQ